MLVCDAGFVGISRTAGDYLAAQPRLRAPGVARTRLAARAHAMRSTKLWAASKASRRLSSETRAAAIRAPKQQSSLSGKFVEDIVQPTVAYRESELIRSFVFEVVRLVYDEYVVVRYRAAAGYDVRQQQRMVDDDDVRGGCLLPRGAQKARAGLRRAFQRARRREPVPRRSGASVSEVYLAAVTRLSIGQPT